ncbi:LuxR C-terminal-related transcriptional regulator [Aquabacterium sp.]|uniref:LuxR C-terminal-related transcriptional regulator n=1 Tax=Aquabacterium sp. TaxID=1872578 RepID=UPI002BF68E5C|nr:LuxR C-terminal-related transcriptional regulator [Aquabacterium sp.]HSW03827.1 LuxR C-terminal-related transcriptional regulator [Aquabacterium sp.]
MPASKLQPPGSRANQVQRGAIAERVLAAAAVKLVLVRAPAGFGKTTAMLQARERLEAAGINTAWLTLDRADNDVPRFLGGLAAAVAQLGLEPRVGSAHGGATGNGSAPLDALEALARDELPFTLFLDDAELIQEPAVLGLLREIIEHLPRRGQLVIGSRSLPDLGLGRLRARGQLLEIDAELLRFSLAEAAEFFRLRAGPALPAGLLSQLHHKTEGWITALWLAAMALERRGAADDFVERFSGSNRAVADYLAEDVLAHQPPEIRDFLLRTSLLRQLDAPVCRALLPRVDCARVLQRLEAANLFVTPIADPAGEPPSYRYHSLFADFLRAQLQREQPDDIARLHLAASGWYEAQGRPVPAIDHAIEGGDHPHALHLLARHAEGFLEQGRMRLLDRWFSAMPPERLREQPLLQVVAVWAQLFTHGPWGANAQLEASGCLRSGDAEVQAHVNALRPMLLAMMDRHEDAYDAGRLSLGRLPSCRPFADSVLSNAMAHIVSIMGQPGEAHRLLDAARRTQGGSSFNRMYTESVEGVLDLKAGRLRQATARFRMAVSATPHAAAYTHTHGNAWAGVLYAGAVYEANELATAEHLLNVYLPLARDVGLPDHMIASHRMRARIAFQRGDVDAAFELLTALEYLGHHRQLPRVVHSAKLERARMLLLQGHGLAARDELNRADDPAVWQPARVQQLQAHDVDDLLIGRLRWDIHFGDARAARPRAEAALAAAEATGSQHRALKLRVLLALTRQRSGDPAGAQATMAELLQQASREGFVRLILDEGPALAPLVQRARAAAQDSRRPEDPIVADFMQRLLAQYGSAALADDSEPAAAASTPGDITEPLTHKEIRVLQLLAEGYSNSAMAEKLFISDSTVRTHLRNINLKLGAHSRTQAVAIARRLRVIA